MLLVHRRAIVVVVHLLLIVASSYAAILLRFDGNVPRENWHAWAAGLPLVVAVRAATFVPFRLYHGLWRYASIFDLRNIVAAVVASSAAVYLVINQIAGVTEYPRSVYVIDAVVLVTLLGGVRLSRRIWREFARFGGRRVIILGAGDAGESVVREMKANPGPYRPIGFIDDDERKHGQHIHGVPVLGSSRDLQRLVARYGPDELLVAMRNIPAGSLRGIVRALDAVKVRISIVPGARGGFGDTVRVDAIRDLRLDDLLSRAPVDIDPAPLRALIAGRRVLVTGAGGSIGSELCRQVAALAPGRLIALDRHENSLFAILNELTDERPLQEVHGVIADITDARRIESVFGEHRPDIVFHAAAHKHVPLMEAHPCEAVKNNVAGSRIVAETARRYDTGRFILISTDKAVNPTSLMGATKRVAELTIREIAASSRTRFATVRFGNVLGSNGSVVLRFMEQIRRGGPVTVTHPEVRRYFMLVGEAVHLVLHAASLDEPGCVYALDMGEQIRVLELARDLIRLSGYVPDTEIPISFVGLRPGEKLSEELVGPGEVAESSGISRVLTLRARAGSAVGSCAGRLASLEALAAAGNVAGVTAALGVLVPEFSPAAPPLAHAVRRRVAISSV